MKAGTLNRKSTGEGGKDINRDGNISVMGGELNTVTSRTKENASPKGVKADGDIAFSGGRIYSYSKYAAAIDAAGSFSFAGGYASLKNDKELFEMIY